MNPALPPGYRQPTHEDYADLLQRNSINRIGAFISSRRLGRFVMQALFAGTIARMVGPECSLNVIYRNDRPYKDFISGLLKYRIDTDDKAMFTGVGFPPDEDVTVGWFDVGGFPEAICPYPWWYKRQMHRPKFFLMPSMYCHPGALPGVIALQIPKQDVDGLGGRLTELGVRPDGWFAALHLFEGRSDADRVRAVDPFSYLEAVKRVLERGGQVVRIGDPTATALPPLPGLIDLSHLPDSFALQAFAVSRARFLIASDAGPAQLSGAFKTPTLITNAIGRAGINACDVVLAKRRRLSDGRVLGTQDLVACGGLTLDASYPPALITEPEILNNTAEEVCRAVTFMIERTDDCAGWRGDQPDDPIEARGQIRWPIEPAPPRCLPFD
jgi:putative glycosyltransferase (TIGR04372 family)